MQYMFAGCSSLTNLNLDNYLTADIINENLLISCGEEDLLEDGNSHVDKVREYASKENASVVLMCAKIESELSELDEESKKEFLADLGIQNSGLDQLIHIHHRHQFHLNYKY